MKINFFILLIIVSTSFGFSQADTSKNKLSYGITLSELGAFTFDKKHSYYKNGTDNYPLFYNLGFYLSKKRHFIDVGIANQIVNTNPNKFYYSLSYSYKVTQQNKIADLSASVKTLSYLYQVHNLTKDVKQITYNDMIACFGTTASRQVNRFTLQLNLFYVIELPLNLTQYKNGHITTLNVGQVQYLPTTFMVEFKVALRLNKKSGS